VGWYKPQSRRDGSFRGALAKAVAQRPMAPKLDLLVLAFPSREPLATPSWKLNRSARSWLEAALAKLSRPVWA